MNIILRILAQVTQKKTKSADNRKLASSKGWMLITHGPGLLVFQTKKIAAEGGFMEKSANKESSYAV